MTQTPTDIAYVDASFVQIVPFHEFNTLQAAIDWVANDQKVKIILYSDLVGIPKLVLTNLRTNITIDGLNEYGITFADDIVDISEDKTLKFRNMAYVNGGRVLVDGDDVNFGVYNSNDVAMNCSLASGLGSRMCIDDSKFYGASGQYGIEVDNPDVEVYIFDSFVQGSDGNPLIMFGAASDRKLRMKNSTILHGSPDVTFPIQRSGDFEVGVRIHNCSSNSRICNDQIDNYIVNNNNNIGDVEIVF